MILYVLPILDLITASALILHTRFGISSPALLLITGTYLGAKGMLFAKTDFASKVDVLCSIYIILAGLGTFSNPTVSLAVFIWLAQKAVLALLPIR